MLALLLLLLGWAAAWFLWLLMVLPWLMPWVCAVLALSSVYNIDEVMREMDELFVSSTALRSFSFFEKSAACDAM